MVSGASSVGGTARRIPSTLITGWDTQFPTFSSCTTWKQALPTGRASSLLPSSSPRRALRSLCCHPGKSVSRMSTSSSTPPGTVKSFGRWEGTAWTGGTEIHAHALLRYALIAPRLVAPHPNAHPESVTAAQAIAMLVQVRSTESASAIPIRHWFRPPMMPWNPRTGTWALYGQMYRNIIHGKQMDIDAMMSKATRPFEQAVATVVGSTALFEEGEVRAALKLINITLDSDRVSPIDFGWLQAQRARCPSNSATSTLHK